jgi:peptide/nickel transport system ATP-binding protein
MPECLLKTPILAENEQNHEVACFLYDTSKALEGVK